MTNGSGIAADGLLEMLRQETRLDCRRGAAGRGGDGVPPAAAGKMQPSGSSMVDPLGVGVEKMGLARQFSGADQPRRAEYSPSCLRFSTGTGYSLAVAKHGTGQALHSQEDVETVPAVADGTGQAIHSRTDVGTVPAVDD